MAEDSALSVAGRAGNAVITSREAEVEAAPRPVRKRSSTMRSTVADKVEAQPPIEPTSIKNMAELARQRRNFPYSKLEVFEKAAVLHHISQKVEADESLQDHAEGIGVLKEHFFLVLEIERLSYAR